MQGHKLINWLLLLKSFASLNFAIIESPVISVIPFPHPFGRLDCSISDGFDSDVLFLASLVIVVANAGWNKTISLVSSVTIPCSLSLFLSLSVSLSVAFDKRFWFKILDSVVACSSVTFNCCVIYAEINDVIFNRRYIFFCITIIFFRCEGGGGVFECSVWSFVPLVVDSIY